MRFCRIQRRRRRVALAMMLLGNRNRVRTMWVHPINENREENGEFFNLYQDLRKYDDKFFQWYRMSIQQFDHVCQIVSPHIQKQYTKFRDPICAEEQFVITIT